MTHTITAQDGSGDASAPTAIVGFDPSADSANEIHRLLDATIAVTLLGDLPRSGSLRLRYETDVDAEVAREILGRPTSFVLTSSTRPVVGMAFVRSGQITSAIRDNFLGHWEFSVGFQEIVL